MRILLVEDNIDKSEVLSTFWGARKDIDCQVINTGPEGPERIRKENFDLILLNLAVPDFSGLDVIRSLKTRRISIFKKHRYLYRLIELTLSERDKG